MSSDEEAKSKHSESEKYKDVPVIDKEHYKKPYEEQVLAHEEALKYLQGASFEWELISAPDPNVDDTPIRTLSEVEVLLIKEKDLSPKITWEKTDGIEDDIQFSGKLESEVHIYGAASQFNGCEAQSRYTPKPGKAFDWYQSDPTQGPRCQIQFSRDQVETLACSANYGFNGLIKILDEDLKTSVRHGYFTPDSPDAADKLIENLRTRGHEVMYLATKSVPVGPQWKSNSKAKWNTDRPENSQVVHQCLVAAPAFGQYNLRDTGVSEAQKAEIEYLCSLRSFQAQMEYLFRVRDQTPDDKLVVFKPTLPGLGVFGNHPKTVGAGFYAAMKQYHRRLEESNVQVRVQSYKGRGASRKVAEMCGLWQFES